MHDKFGFIKAEENLNVTIRGNDYLVQRAGSGIPCLLICLGTPSFRTLSKQFTEGFEVYSTDTYWLANAPSINPDELTMESIIDDIKSLGDKLNIKDYILFAHSAYGIIALEFAKKYPKVARGIIMIGTPVNSNPDILAKNQLIFEELADPERKVIDTERRNQFAQMDLSQLTDNERWLCEYVYRDAPRYWHIPDFDCSKLWKGISLSALFVKLFNKILPETNVLTNLEKIKTPIFLASGVSDYDCCPWEWQQVKNLPQNFTYHLFKQSGHWPHYEEPELFNEKIKEWATFKT